MKANVKEPLKREQQRRVERTPRESSTDLNKIHTVPVLSFDVVQPDPTTMSVV